MNAGAGSAQVAGNPETRAQIALERNDMKNEPTARSNTETAPRPDGWTRTLATLRSPSFLYALLTVFLWGVWALESKVVLDRVSPWMNQVLFSIGLLPVLLGLVFSRNLRTVHQSRKRGAAYGLLTGVLGGTGNLAMYVALARGGKASIVVPLVGLAPLVTVLLAWFTLKESLNVVQLVGLVFALISIYLLSI